MKHVVFVAIALGVLFSSGYSASQVINTGGDTNLEISAPVCRCLTYCKTLGKPDSKMSEAPHG